MKKIFLITMLLILLIVTPGDMLTQAQDFSMIPQASNDAYIASESDHFDHTTYLPLVVQSTSTEDFIVAENTRVLSTSTTQYLSEISEDLTIFTFSQTTPELLALESGDIIVGDPTENAPHGFLRTVSSMSFVNDQVVVVTTDATLEEAIQHGSISVSGNLHPEDAQEIILAPGVTMVENDQERDGKKIQSRFDLSHTFFEDAYGYVGTSGYLDIEIVWDFNLAIRWFKLQELSFDATLKEELELFFEAEYSYSFDTEPRYIATMTFPPVPIPAPIPIWITPVMDLYVGANGEVNAEFSTGITHEFIYRLGFEYDGDKWTDNTGLVKNNFAHIPPVVSLDVRVKAYAGVQGSFLFYGVAGPYVALEPWLEFQADIDAIPWWTLDGGLDLKLGIELRIITFRANQEFTIPMIGPIRIAEASAHINQPPYVPSNPSPAHGQTDVQPRPRSLSWVGGDPDNDAVTYDVYIYPANESANAVLVCNSISTTTCNVAGGLSYDTDYVWFVIAEDVHGVTTTGPNWSFRTGRGADSARFEGHVTCAVSGLSLQNAEIEFEWVVGPITNTHTVTSDQHGYYSTYIMPYTFRITASKIGYISQTIDNVTIGDNQDITLDFILDPIMVKHSGNVNSLWRGDGAHNYPLYARLSYATSPLDPFATTVFSDPFTGYFEIFLPALRENHFVTVTSLIGGHDRNVNFTFEHGYEDNHNNQIEIQVDVFLAQNEICAPGYQWGRIGPDTWGCRVVPGGFVAGFTFDNRRPLIGPTPLVGAFVSSHVYEVETESFGDPSIDPDNVGFYFLFVPTKKQNESVWLNAQYPKDRPQISDGDWVDVVQSQIVRQDFYLEPGY